MEFLSPEGLRLDGDQAGEPLGEGDQLLKPSLGRESGFGHRRIP